MSKTTYAGINYAGAGSTVNMDAKTGIRYGIIAQRSVMPEALDDIFTHGRRQLTSAIALLRTGSTKKRRVPTRHTRWKRENDMNNWKLTMALAIFGLLAKMVFLQIKVKRLEKSLDKAVERDVDNKMRQHEQAHRGALVLDV